MQLVDEQSDDDVGTDPVVSSDSSNMTEKKIVPKVIRCLSLQNF